MHSDLIGSVIDPRAGDQMPLPGDLTIVFLAYLICANAMIFRQLTGRDLLLRHGDDDI